MSLPEQMTNWLTLSIVINYLEITATRYSSIRHHNLSNYDLGYLIYEKKGPGRGQRSRSIGGVW